MLLGLVKSEASMQQLQVYTSWTQAAVRTSHCIKLILEHFQRGLESLSLR